MDVHQIFYCLAQIVIGVTFVLSSAILIKNNTFGYLRLFPFYHASSLFTEIITQQFFISPPNKYVTTSNVPYNLFTLIEFLFFSFYIFHNVNTGKSIIITSIIFFITLYSVSMVRYNFGFPPHLVLLLQNLFLLVQCIVYFNDVFTTFSSSNLAKEPEFWIITGIMFYSIITSPMQIYRHIYGMDSEVETQVYITTNANAYLMMYLLFIKGYTCKAAK
jgi:hypothetical protein